jgi:ferredoxin
MSTELYYFSGTGNTPHVSKELSRRLPGSRLVPIAGLATLATIRTEAATVGVLSPLHGMTLPIPVEAFLKRLDPESADYIFAVTTRGGTRSRGVAKMQRILRSKGSQLDASFILDMPSNDPKFKKYRTPRDDGITFSRIRPIVFLLETLVGLGMAFAKHSGANKYIYADEKCKGCGTCEKVCPPRKISLEGGGPPVSPPLCNG